MDVLYGILLQYVPQYLLEFAQTYWPTVAVGAILILIAIVFVVRFIFPAVFLGMRLKRSLSALDLAKSKVDGCIVELSQIADGAMRPPSLSHLWGEYAKTLHRQRKDDDSGQSMIVCWRATTLAESFFTEQAIVDTPLKTEFYKHLPGILTGLGIIGTFSGLIMGLIHFDVSLDPVQAQEQLRNLVNSVGHAFFVSGAAIALAMVFTWVEKSMVTARYRQVEGLRQAIDSMFHAGAGEEYLERLVVAAETSATQAAQIKDALVADIREILTGLTAQQVEASAVHTGRLSSDIANAIKEGLGGPMKDIGDAVKNVTASQGDAVNKMLTDVLASFSSQMQEMFGGQMRGLSDLLQQTSDGMASTTEQLRQLVANIDKAGSGAVEAMGERLTEALNSMEARQRIMNDQMGQFVEQIRALVSESQTESGKKLQEALGSIGEQVVGVVGELRRLAEEASEADGVRRERFEDASGKAMESLSQQMERLLAQSVETNRSLQDAVGRLASATTDTITRMNTGAETLYIAASDFAKAGQGVAETMRASTAAVENIKAAAATLSTASGSARDILVDYGRTRDAFAAMVTELKATVETAKRDASMTSEIVSKIETAAGHLGAAQRQTEEYLEGVNEVLVKAHSSFAENVERTLREGNRQFQKELSQAVGLLSGSVKDLADALDVLPVRN